MKIVFMGSPEFAVPVLTRLVEDGQEIIAVYTQPDKPAGRGQTMHIPPVKSYALSKGFMVKQPLTLKDAAVQDELKALAPDIIIVVAYGLFLPDAVLETPVHGCINVHPSILPRHRGAAPVVSTILSGDTWGGVSIMKMDSGWDTGDILAVSKVLIRPEDTTDSLMSKLSIISASMMSDILPRWISGKIVPRPQDNAEATYFKMMKKEDGLIDWSLDAVVIRNRVRALQPWPGTFTHIDGKLLKILSCEVLDTEINGNPGTVIVSKRDVDVVTGKGLLRLGLIQPEGKKAMPAIDYARGNGFPKDCILA